MQILLPVRSFSGVEFSDVHARNTPLGTISWLHENYDKKTPGNMKKQCKVPCNYDGHPFLSARARFFLEKR